MSSNGPFGIDPEEFDRVVREAGESLRDALESVSRFVDRAGDSVGWTALLDGLVGGQLGAGRTPARRPAVTPETVDELGGGVWVIFTHDSDGATRVEQAFPTEIEALRANKNNTDPTRKVRFLPFGVPVAVLDADERD